MKQGMLRSIDAYVRENDLLAIVSPSLIAILLTNCALLAYRSLGMLTVRIFGQFSTDFHFNFCSILPPT